MKKAIRAIRFVILAILCCNIAQASHLLGGEMTYTYLGNNDYKITLRYYRDCKSGDAATIGQDDPIYFSVFDGNGMRVLSDSIFSVSKSNIAASQLSPCTFDPTVYCVNMVEFSKTINLPSNGSGYLIVNQRCCLINAAANIIQSGQEGLSLYCIIPAATAQPNSSPSFNTPPIVRNCVNRPFQLNFSATDADGDSLAYRLTPALRGGGAGNAKPIPTSTSFPPLTYTSSFSAAKLFGPYGSINIDSTTGVANCFSGVVGNFLVSVACDEYRNGNLISSTFRIFTSQIAGCQEETTASLVKDSAAVLSGISGLSIDRCDGNRTVNFKNNSTGATSYFWDFGVPGQNDDTSSLENPMFTYPAAGKYNITLIAYGENCNDTLHTQVWLSDDGVIANFDVTGGPCILDTFILTDKSTVSAGSTVKSYRWLTESGTYEGNPVSAVFTEDGSKKVSEIVLTNGGCIGLTEQNITIGQAPIFAGNDTTIVRGTPISLSANGGISYDWYQFYSIGQSYYFGSGATIIPPEAWLGINTYYAVGQDANGCTGVDSIVVTTSENGYVFTPSAFSPNGDGKNDVLRVQMSGYNFRSFSIFNRLGNRVFYSERLQHGWDGKYKNNPAPIDTYFWMLNAKNDQGGDEVFKGDVVLVR